MTEHLTECIYAPEEFDFEQNIVWGGKPCICDRLRACEQRVEESMSRAWQQTVDMAVAHTRVSTLDAAREAIKNTRCPEGYEVKGCSHWDDALAAIDRLEAMNEHLPECPMANDCKHDYYNEPPIQCADCGESCICDRLRACEQRVLAEREADGPWFRSVVHQCCEDKQTAYAAGLDAAREAVASMVIETVGNSAATVEQAVSVIDALREKT